MSQQSTLEITDRNGWRKEFTLTKTITNIGSDPRNDIVLENWRGSGVASRHLQLIYSAGDLSGQEYRLVNLGDADVIVGPAGATVSPRSTAAVASGHHIRLGDFDLVLRAVRQTVDRPTYEPQPAFRERAANGFESSVSPAAVPEAPMRVATQPGDGQRASDLIGLNLAMSGTRLSAETPLDGWLTVRNQGDRQGVQFRIEVEGLDPEIYEIGPAPILFPGAEKAIPLRLRPPRRPTPAAGEYELSIRVTAPEAYPGECAVVAQRIEILPFRSHTLRILPDEALRSTSRRPRE